MTRLLPPEDIEPGMYVSILQIVEEHMPFLFDDGEAARQRFPLRIVRMPWSGSTPRQVVDVCLPFVLVRNAQGKPTTVDVRRCRLGRVSNEFGQRVFAEIEAHERKKEGEDEEPKNDPSPSTT